MKTPYSEKLFGIEFFRTESKSGILFTRSIVPKLKIGGFKKLSFFESTK